MKIISNFTDYYDMMQQYGKDENIVFKRINAHGVSFENDKWILSGLDSALKNHKKTEELSRASFKNFFKRDPVMNSLKGLIDSLNPNDYDPNVLVTSIYVVVNGKPFKHNILLEKQNGSMVMVNRKITPEGCFNYLKNNADKLSNIKFRNKTGNEIFKKSKTFEEFSEETLKKYKKRVPFLSAYTKVFTEEDFINIHKEVNSPVYIIVGDKVLTDIPLMSLGINDLFNNNVEQLYQEISYCLGNVINNKNEPPLQVSNDIKIEQHGFDKKQSFRHRK